MDNKSYTVSVPKRSARIVLLVGVVALVVAPLTAVATHSFTDVPDTHTFHDDIEWLKDSDVTRGCNPPANTLFCPEDNVKRSQMAAFMKRFAEYLGASDGTPAQADNADTAVTAGTAYEAINGDLITLTGTSSGTADSIATLDGLPAGAYLVTATWHTTAHGGGAGARIVCDVTAGSSSSRVVAQIQNPGAGQESMAGVLTGNVGAGDVVNLSCWRENQVGSQSIGNAHLVAYPVTEIQSGSVSE
jgi:hypothetical protein